METKDAKEQAATQYSSIVAMLDAINCDYDRLTELTEEREELVELGSHAELIEWDRENGEELEELNEAAGEYTDQDDAMAALYDSPLEVLVRSGWAGIGEELEAEEFVILLCTGGPAVRIRGNLDGYDVTAAWLEYQDWGTPWTHYTGASQSVLIEFAQYFFSN